MSETGENLSETGENLSETGENLSETGENLSETGENLSETGENLSETGEKKTLSLTKEPRRMELRGSGDTAQVKQSFSHGRSKTVQVEVRRNRAAARAPALQPVPVPEPAAPPVEALPIVEQAPGDEGRIRHVLPTLSEAEKATRARALDVARRADQQARENIEEQARLRTLEEKRLQAENEAAEIRRKSEEDRRRTEVESRQRAEEGAERKLREQEARSREDDEGVVGAAPGGLKLPGGLSGRQAIDAEEESARGRRTPPGRRTPAPKRNEPRRRSGRMTINQALDVDDSDARVRSLASVRRERERLRQARADRVASGAAPQKIYREVVIPESITVQELSNRMAERATDLIRALMKLDVMATINQSIDSDTAELLVNEFGHTPKLVSAADVEIGLVGADDMEGDLQPRPPVVTVMGHVDHGKTSLLDALRETNVVAGEAGGITQHIGAYQVEGESGKITFIDTPGHEAFTQMRARGAGVTDIVVLVVAADDGVMPQTVEAINHAKAAEVPIIVAVNKIDRKGADPERVTRELLQHEVVSEKLGGDVQVIEVSATERINLDKLEEAITLQAEILELGANPNREAEGVIVEAKLDRGRGPVATVLIQRGTLRVGDIFVAGFEWGRVRALIDGHGRNIEEAGPSMPVEVLGLNGTPLAGDHFTALDSEARAREVTAYRQATERDRRASQGARSSVQQMFAEITAGERQELPIVIKGDVQGSVEAIVGALERLGTDEVAVRVLHSGVGGVTESDVTLAAASAAPILGFNVRANAQTQAHAKRDGVELRYYSVIYELVDDIKAALSGMLAPERREEMLGTLDVLEVFSITKVGRIAGCRVSGGVVRPGARARLLRDSIVVHDGNLKSLRRFKDDVREVREGNECGVALENYQDLQPGDVLEVYEVEEIERVL